MKIGIVTVYDSENCGSFLQALALKTVLGRKDEVFFYKLGVRNPIKENLFSAGKKFLILKWGLALFICRKIYKFVKCWKVFKCCSLEEFSDVCVIGSDEIWNLNRKKFSEHSVFWGEGIKSTLLISYAPSCNGADMDLFKHHAPAIKFVKRAEGISVRDGDTAACIEKLTTKKIERVLDPTFLLSSDEYKIVEKEIKYRNYILLYTSTKKIPKECIEEIRSFAKNNQLTLISINQRLEWCDVSYPASPYEFLNFYRNASYVITDTFHGTVFSIIYNKKVAVFGRNNNKVLDLLSYFEIENINVSNEASIYSILDGGMDWERINCFIKEKRIQSLKFLYRGLGEKEIMEDEIRQNESVAN